MGLGSGTGIEAEVSVLAVAPGEPGCAEAVAEQGPCQSKKNKLS